MRSRYACGAVEVPSWCPRGTLVVRSRYARGAVEVRSRCGRAVEVRSWYGPSTVEVRSWCASGSVSFVNFSTGDTVSGESLLGYRFTASISILEWVSPGELGAGTSNISIKGSRFG